MAKGILFDLDGTLLDTARDMLFALELLARENDIKDVPNYQDGKELITYGSKAIVNSIFGDLKQEQFKSLQNRYLKIYEQNLNQNTCFFDGVEDSLNFLNKNNIPWGVVTNKPIYLAQPLIDSISLFQTSIVLIGGDSTPHSKPHPLPLQEAAKALKIPPKDFWYVGDAKSDIDAANAAGMKSAVASWGYIKKNDNPHNWEPDLILSTPRKIETLFN